MTDGAVAIEFRGLRARYGTREALCGVDGEIRAGRLTALLGPNGSGKTTLLRALAGLHPPAGGEIRLNGLDGTAMTARERARHVAYLPQQHRAVFPLTVREAVLTGRAGRFGWRPAPRDWAVVDRVLREVGLEPLADRPYTEVSGGEQQRVLIARLLAQEAPILLLDEPTAHLDLHRQCELMAALRRWCRGGRTVLVVLHDPNIAFAWADDWLALREGARYRPAAALWTEAALRELYPAEFRHLPVGARAAVVPSDRVAPWGHEPAAETSA